LAQTVYKIQARRKKLPEGSYLDGSWSVGCLDVTCKTDDLEWWGLDDRDGFDDLLLVDGGPRLLSLSDYMSHTSLEAHEGSKVDWLVFG